MLQDSGLIFEEDAEYLNRKKLRRGEQLSNALYQTGCHRVKQYFLEIRYRQSFEPIPGCELPWGRRAHFRLCRGLSGYRGTRQVHPPVFSGDIGRPGFL